LHPARPDLGFLDTQFNWENWNDQGIYFSMASKVVNGTFSSNDYLPTGLGYPILAIPSIILSGGSVFLHHTFFVPNLLIFVSLVFLAFRLMKRFTKDFWLSILGLAAFFFVSPFILWSVEPWNGHVVEFGILGIIFLLMGQNITNKSIIFASILAGWIFSARLADVLWVLPIFAAFFSVHPKKIVYFFPFVLIVGLVLLSHWVYFDDPLATIFLFDRTQTPELYNSVGLDRINFDFITISNRTFCLFLNPLSCVPAESGVESVDTWWYKALYNKFPILVYGLGLLVFSPLGIFLLLKKLEPLQKIVLIGILVGFSASFLFYTSLYNFTSGWTLFFRYHIFWLPVFAVFSIYGLKFLLDGFRNKITNQSEN